MLTKKQMRFEVYTHRYRAPDGRTIEIKYLQTWARICRGTWMLIRQEEI